MQGLADALHANLWQQAGALLQALQAQADTLYGELLRPLLVRCGGEFVVAHLWSPELGDALWGVGAFVLLSDLRALWGGGLAASGLLAQ